MRNPMFQRYGGAKGVSRLVFRFYDLVLQSDRLRPFFDGLDMPMMVEHQAAVLASVLSGRPSPGGAELAAMHAHLEIGEAEFDEMVQLLAEAIAAEGYPEAEADRVLLHYRRMREHLVGELGQGSPVGA